MNGASLVEQPLDPLVRGSVPEWLLPAFVVLTELGNVGLFLVLFALDYWFVDHERGAHAISLVLGGMAAIAALKFFFAVPRPPAEVNVVPISGFSFPSGHAMAATIAYGTLAADLRIGTRRQRFSAAGLVVLFVALSRVVLGVHFVRDVVAGVLFGVGYLVVALAITNRDPRAGFFLAAGVSVVAFAVSAGSHDGVAVLGAAVGALVGWELLDEIPRVTTWTGHVALATGVLPLLVGLGYVSTFWSLPLAAVFLLDAAALAALLGAPLLEKPLERVVYDGTTEPG